MLISTGKVNEISNTYTIVPESCFHVSRLEMRSSVFGGKVSYSSGTSHLIRTKSNWDAFVLKSIWQEAKTVPSGPCVCFCCIVLSVCVCEGCGVFQWMKRWQNHLNITHNMNFHLIVRKNTITLLYCNASNSIIYVVVWGLLQVCLPFVLVRNECTT